MKRTTTTMTTMFLTGTLMLAAGCADIGEYDGAAHSAKIKKEQAMAGAPKPEYHEVSHEGRRYVVGSKQAADNVANGIHPATAITKIGAGPDGQTVVFEANKTYGEDHLMQEYVKRHGPLR